MKTHCNIQQIVTRPLRATRIASGLIFVAGIGGCASAVEDGETVGRVQSSITLNAVTRESFTAAGVQGDGDSSNPAVSADGRFVVFSSTSDNFVPGDTNRSEDIFVKDRQTGAISRASTDASGNQANLSSFTPSISGDGRFVAFLSNATNLVPATDVCFNSGCVFVKDRTTGSVVLVNVPFSGALSGGAQNPQISGNGRFVAFQSSASNLVPSDTNGHQDIFVRDLQTNQTTLASVSSGVQGNGDSTDPSISADGRFVSFSTLANNFLINDGNGVSDVFVRDLQAGTTSAISFTSTGQGGAPGNGASDAARISGDGQHVVFRSAATNFGTDTNGVADTFVKTLGTLTPVRVSISSGGAQGNGASGRQNAISFNGNYIAFVSAASNLVANDTNGIEDVFVRDLVKNQTVRVNVSNSGQQANAGFDILSSLSFNGTAALPTPSLLAFDSLASDLVTPDTNNNGDVFSASISP